ncbi:HepT-like ribonuclease domain-containing protein [Rhizobium sp. 18055]|uniref:HepT-like ribonuclease domain-containing protein n=1 Tax=Rhizobium sp. 18055 TaxID=2681403 RepID=UPI0013574B8F
MLPSHDWQAIRGVGNVLRHDYDSIILHRTWETVEKNIRPLLLDVEAAITAHEAAEK